MLRPVPIAWRHVGPRASAALTAALLAAPAAFAETQAGTPITNVARLRAEHGGTATDRLSNPVTVIVAERLDLALALAGDPRADGDGTLVPVTVTNTGNGSEPVELALAGEDAASGTIRLDDGGGTPLAGGRTAPVAPGAALRLLVRVARGGGAPVTITARATTGAGAPGTALPGTGDGGGDAVVGASGAAAKLTVPLGGATLPVLDKSASVAGADGGTVAVPGAVITYTLVARAPAPFEAARVNDPIPAGTRYVAGSLTLDGAALTDADDGDAGRAGDAGIAVTLGTLVAGTPRTVRFQVTVQ